MRYQPFPYAVARKFVRDALGRFAPVGTVNRAGKRKDVPKAPHVLEIGGRKNRKKMPDSQSVINGYVKHFKENKRRKTAPNAIAWYHGRKQAEMNNAPSRQKMQAGTKKTGRRKGA